MAHDPATERPRALLLQIEADIQALCDIRLTEQQAEFDSFSPHEQEWFRAHQTWEGEIVTSQEFLRRLNDEPWPTPDPEPPLASRLRLSRSSDTFANSSS